MTCSTFLCPSLPRSLFSLHFASVFRYAQPQLSASGLHRRIDSRPPRDAAATTRIRTHSATDSVENRCRPAILLWVTLNECQRSPPAAAAAAPSSVAAAAVQSSPDTATFAASVAVAVPIDVVHGRSTPQQPNNHIVPSRTNILFLGFLMPGVRKNPTTSHPHPPQ